MSVPGAGHGYSQTAGQTTIDGTLTGINGGATFTGGTILGAGTVRGNVSAGNASGAAVTINVGDTGKAGLLSITGAYTQLATAAMTGFVNGTTAGTGYSELKVTGSAALAGTINFTVASAFQSTLTVGETFNALTASSVTGTFSNSTIAINSSFHFNVTYTATGVVLTVASGPTAPPNSVPARSAASAMATAKPVASKTQTVAAGGLRYAPKGLTRTFVVASGPLPKEHEGSIISREESLTGPRSWEKIPTTSVSQIRPMLVAAPARTANVMRPYSNSPARLQSDLRLGNTRAIGVRLPQARMGALGNRIARSPLPMAIRVGR